MAGSQKNRPVDPDLQDQDFQMREAIANYAGHSLPQLSEDTLDASSIPLGEGDPMDGPRGRFDEWFKRVSGENISGGAEPGLIEDEIEHSAIGLLALSSDVRLVEAFRLVQSGSYEAVEIDGIRISRSAQ